MIHTRLFLRVIALFLLIGGSATVWIGCKDKDYVERLTLDVPAIVLEAANRAIPGGKIQEAEEALDVDIVYRIQKSVNNTEYAIRVTADGVVKDIERKNDEDTEVPPVGRIKSKRLKDLSGIVPAEEEGEYWAHGDRGGNAEICRFSIQGKILQRVRLRRAKNFDWEGMTVDSDGVFYIGDFGDNDLRRDYYSIYKLTEPEASISRMSGVDSYRFEYADGESRNCEALFAMDDRLYLITKKGKEIFCIDKLDADETIQTREVGKMDIRGQVTDADYSPERKQLVVLTKKRIVFYKVTEEADLLKQPVRSIRVSFGQSEAICYDGDYLVITNESGKIWKYPMEVFLKR